MNRATRKALTGTALAGIGLAAVCAVLLQRQAANQLQPKITSAVDVAEAPYAKVPEWSASYANSRALGLALADLDGDGFDDMIVANGGDVVTQHVIAYRNDGQGTFSKEPFWVSADQAFHSNVAVGDIDGDGWNDVVVSVGLGNKGNPENGWVKAYFNRHGTLEALPSYQSERGFSSPAVALADIDGDGDLDLAASVALTTGNHAGPAARFYRNLGGSLQTEPYWQARAPWAGFGLGFADLDGDGLLDFAVSGPHASAYLAEEDASSIRMPEQPSWQSSGDYYTGTYLELGPVGDPKRFPLPALAIAYSGCGLTHGKSARAAYRPMLAPAPIFLVGLEPCPSSLLIADVTADGFPDLVAGSWQVGGAGSPLLIYPGNRGGFADTASYSSSVTPVAEAMALSDLRRRKLVEKTESFTIETRRAIVTLSRARVQAIKQVARNGKLLARGEYVSVPGRNWVSFAKRLQPGEEVRVDYQYSDSLDLAVASFGSSEAPGGAMVFYHR